MVTRYDVIEVTANISPEGWIRDKPVITRAGIFEYRTANGKVIKEYRPDTEVFNQDSLNSALGIPVTDNHRGMVNSKNVDNIIGTVLGPAAKDEANVVAEVIIHNPGKLGDKRELSLGYTCDVDDTPGEINGQRYDSIQKNIRYNHLAVVKKGRAGNARLRLDSTDAVHGNFELEDNNMEVKLVAVRLDGIDYQASPEVGNALTKAQTSLADLQKRFDGVEAERDKLKGDAAKHEKDLKAAREQARETIRDRLELEDAAGQLKIKFDADDSDMDIKQKILGKLRPELKLDGKSEDYVNSAFDLSMEDNKDRTKKVAGQLKRFDAAGGDKGNVQQMSSSDAARQRYLKRLRGEKVEGDGGKAA